MDTWLNTLTKHVVGAWGEHGKQWLEALPDIVETLAEQWQLKNINPINFPSYNYVAFCDQEPNNPVVLKISCDAQLIADEYKTHQHFNGLGSVKVFAYDDQLNAVLLERAVPGDVLKALDRDSAINIYADVVKKLHSCKQNDMTSYMTSEKWLQTIDRMQDNRLKKYICKAKEFVALLAKNPQEKKICHGDLHLENIILHGKEYLAIDPKGVVGELAFELAAFDLLTDQEMQQEEVSSLIKQRVLKLSENAHCDKDRLFMWFYLRCLLGAQWFIEDEQDPSLMIKMLEHLSKMNHIY